MKMTPTVILTFTFAVTVFAFNASPVFAKSAFDKCMDAWNNEAACREHLAKLDGLRDPEQSDNERDVADSGNEDSTSAASASDQ